MTTKTPPAAPAIGGPSAPPRRTRARRGQGELLREEILAAATALLAETGDEQAVSVRAIAKRVGVSTPAIYLHFTDRQALLDAVCDQVWQRLEERMSAAARGVNEPMEALHQRGLAYVHFGLENPEHYRIVMMDRRADPDPGNGHADLLTAGSAFASLVAAVTRCAEAGVFKPYPGQDAVDPIALGVRLWAAAHGVTSLLIAKPHFPWPPVEELVEGVIRMSGFGLAVDSRLAAGNSSKADLPKRLRSLER